jgi:hypothetical protein
MGKVRDADPRCWDCDGYGVDCAGVTLQETKNDELRCHRIGTGVCHDLMNLVMQDEE